jgi:putative FmdB family regulatory protein
MPLYSYKCGSCGHEFSEVLKIDDRKTPCESNCPDCETQGQIEMVVSSPRIVAGVGNLHSKVSNNFRDRLKEIHKAAGRHSTIET